MFAGRTKTNTAHYFVWLHGWHGRRLWDACDREVFLKMTCEVGVPAKGLAAVVIGTKDPMLLGRMTGNTANTNREIHRLLSEHRGKKKLTGQWQACQTPRLHEPGH